eukprot:m.159881 g.159881  ORF g.159881 m.159881 type:complete len:423 (+) comp11874_c0_seq1:192-1460(+)
MGSSHTLFVAILGTLGTYVDAQCACNMTDAGVVAGTFNVAYKVQATVGGCADRVCFEINITNAANYYGIGLSTSGSSMGSLEKLVAGRVGSTPYVYHAASGGGYNAPSLSVDAACITVESITGTNTLRFSRTLDGSTCTQTGSVLTSTSTVNLATALGSWQTSAASSGIYQHFSVPPVASVSLDATGTSNANAADGADNDQRAGHGTVMCISWLTLTPIAVFVMRYLRGMLSEGGAFFKIHMGLQLAVTVLTLVGIFRLADQTGNMLDESKWPGDKEHQRLGLSVLVLVLVQTLMGLGRNLISGKPITSDPKDHGPRRWVFDIAHALLGVTTWAVAVAAVYKGIELIAVFNQDVKEESLKTMVVVWAIIIVIIFFAMDLYKLMTNQMDKFTTPNTALWLVGCVGVVVISIVATVVIGTGIQA